MFAKAANWCLCARQPEYLDGGRPPVRKIQRARHGIRRGPKPSGFDQVSTAPFQLLYSRWRWSCSLEGFGTWPSSRERRILGPYGRDPRQKNRNAPLYKLGPSRYVNGSVSSFCTAVTWPRTSRPVHPIHWQCPARRNQASTASQAPGKCYVRMRRRQGYNPSWRGRSRASLGPYWP
jgi:hypothetical protein